ncbi:MAG: hypothetical protein ACXQTW_04460 [Candidatus Methanospirareceae archaeon]
MRGEEKLTRYEKLEERLKGVIRSIIIIIVGAVAGFFLQNWGIIAVNLSAEVVGFTIVGIGLALTFWYVRAIGRDVSDLVSKVEEGFNKLVRVLREQQTKDPNNPSRNPEKIRTTGAGALAGMIAGGAIGLLGGPAGAVLGGIIGALVGREVEYEQEKERRKKL